MTTILTEIQAAYAKALSLNKEINTILTERSPLELKNVEFYNIFCRTLETTLTTIRRAVEETQRLHGRK